MFQFLFNQKLESGNLTPASWFSFFPILFSFIRFVLVSPRSYHIIITPIPTLNKFPKQAKLGRKQEKQTKAATGGVL